MKAYYQALEQPSNENSTNHTYKIWRKMNANYRTTIDANKLANVKRDISKNERLTEAELERIKSDIRKNQQLSDTAENESNASTDNMTRDDNVTHNDEGNDNYMLESEQNEEERKTLDMKQQILEKWEEIKIIEQGQRVKLPNINKDRKAKELIKISNKALSMIKEQHHEPLDVTEINELLYATAAVITEKKASDLKSKENERPNSLRGKKELKKKSLG